MEGLVAKATARPRPARARGNSPGRAGCPLLPLPAPPDQAEEPPPTPPPPPPLPRWRNRAAGGRASATGARRREEGRPSSREAPPLGPPPRGAGGLLVWRKPGLGELQLPEGLSYPSRGRRKGGGELPLPEGLRQPRRLRHSGSGSFPTSFLEGLIGCYLVLGRGAPAGPTFDPAGRRVGQGDPRSSFLLRLRGHVVPA